MQLYPGTDPVTPWASFTWSAGHGLWPTPDVATGGDKRFAAELMAAVQSATDRTNTVGWRVAYLNPIEGSTSTFTSAIHTKNGWDFNGACQVSGASAEWRFKVDSWIQSGSTMHLGDTVGATAGSIFIHRGSGITTDGGGSGSGNAFIRATGAFGLLRVDGGAAFLVSDTSDSEIQGNLALGQSGDSTKVVTRYAPMVRSGTAAYDDLRITTLPDASATFTASESDIWLIPTLTAGRTWTPAVETGKDFTYVVQAIEPTTQNFDGDVVLWQLNARFKFTASTTGQGAVTVFHRGNGDTHRLVSAFDGLMVGSNSSPLLLVT